MENKNIDIKWKQRFTNYRKALGQLKKFIEKKELSDMEKQGLIKAFEYTFELAWNVMKDYYEYQGESDIQGSRDAIRLAFNRGLLQDGSLWMEMIQSRINTAHIYNEEIAEKIAAVIITDYYSLFKTFESTMNDIFTNLQTEIF
jgi:nucleotidyltransferase substrate binding protein (TIGR01987 family)